MATYMELARSNYFTVRDKDAFKEFLDHFSSVELIEDDQGRVGFMAHDGLPLDLIVDKDTGEDDHIDFVGELSGHLADGEVAVVQVIGWEKMRYLNAYATAVNSKQDVVTVDISDIYPLAKELTDRPEEVTAVQY